MIGNILNKIRGRTTKIESTVDESSIEKQADDDEENNHQWDRPIEFVLSLISNSVGLGNVWRFPYLAAKNGGGAFLIPYFSLYFLIGAPLYYLELALGQFTSRGPTTGFGLARGWQGVGIAMMINSILGTLYYNVIIAWALFYFILSFRSRLLWADCGHWWNTDRCFVPGEETLKNVTNITGECAGPDAATRVTASEEFYYRLLLNKSCSFDEFGVPTTYMSLLLFGSWLIICLCIIRGVQSTGKVAYFTAIFPYIVLLVLIIYTATLKGAGEGIRFYIVPRWKLIGDFKIWQAAASQVFFSLSISFGSLIAYAAANPFNNNFFKQMCIVVSCDCFTGVFAGFAVFATIGFLAASLDEPVAKIAESSGPGLAFITYPTALARMPASPFFSIIFFMMLLALGLGSQFASTDVPVTALMELFPAYAKRRSILVILICIVFFLVSLPFATPGGIYLFELFQEYTANISLVFIGFFEVTSVSYVYGFNRFMNDVKMMLGKRAAQYYLFVTWCISAPLLTLILTIMNLINSSALTLEAAGGYPTYNFPQWSTVLGWLIFAFCILPIPLFFVIRYVEQFRKILVQRRLNGQLNEADTVSQSGAIERPVFLAALTETTLPDDTWGPRRKANQIGIYAHLRKRKTPRNSSNSKAQVLSKRPSTQLRRSRKSHNSEGMNNPVYNPEFEDYVNNDESSNAKF